MTTTSAIDRAVKLLALARGRGTTAAEAAAAAAAAHNLMRRHNLSEAMLPGGSDHPTVDRDFPLYESGKLEGFLLRLADGTAKANDCRIILIRGFWGSCNRLRSKVCLVGRPGDVAVTRHLFMYLRREIARLATEWQREQNARSAATAATLRAHIGSFRFGVVSAVIGLLQQQNIDIATASATQPFGLLALARLQDRDRASEALCRLEARSAYTVPQKRHDAAAHAAGVAIGRRIAIRRAMDTGNP